MSNIRIKTKKIINVKMVERYRHINKFRFSIFKLTNPSMATELEYNPIMGEIVLVKLKELRNEIKDDISKLSPRSIKAEDILGERNLEISDLLATEVCFYNLIDYKNKYDSYLKGKTLERIFPIKRRNEEFNRLNKEIDELEQTVIDLEIIDEKIAEEEKKKLRKLKLEKEEFIEKFDFSALEEIEEALFIRVHSYITRILEDIEDKIDYLERNIA